MLSVQQLFDQYANPLYGSSYGASVAVTEFASKTAEASTSSVELVFSAAAISSLSQAGYDLSTLDASGGWSLYGSDGSVMSVQSDTMSILRSMA